MAMVRGLTHEKEMKQYKHITQQSTKTYTQHDIVWGLSEQRLHSPQIPGDCPTTKPKTTCKG